MKSLGFLFAIIIISVLTFEDDDVMKEARPLPRGELIDQKFAIFNRKEDRVKYYVRTHSHERIEIKREDMDSLKHVDPSKPIKVFTHGFRSHSGAQFPENVVTVFRDVKQGNVNLLVVDWSCSAGTQSCQLITDYCTTVEQIEGIAQEVGSFLAWMHSNLGLNGSETNFYGHSLGAHVLGGAGRQFRSLLGTNISLIVGLDPAGPGFHGSNPPSRPLSRTDATNVVVFVTDGTAYGMPNPDATTIYLNGGGISPQPMCEDLYLDVFAACSHSASHVYYTDLIYLFDSESLKAPLPICADTPTGKVDIVLGDRIAELTGDRYFVNFRGFPKLQDSSGRELMEPRVEEQLRSLRNVSAALLRQINCLPKVGQKYFADELPALKVYHCRSHKQKY